MHPLTIRHITVRGQAVDLEVAVALDALRVDARAASRICRVLPNLPRHVCVNGRGETFGDELVGTESAHLLEHVLIELQGRAATALGRTGAALTGHTSWLEELAGTGPAGYALMRVTVGYFNDFVALRACETARELVEWALAGSPDRVPDVEARIDALVELARSSGRPAV